MTLAAFLRVGLVLQLAAGGALAYWLLPPQWAWLAVPAALAVPLLGNAIVLALEFALAGWFDPRRPAVAFHRTLAVWWGETLTSVRAFALVQPFAAAFPEPGVTPDPQRPAVLLVHGYVCNRAVWRRLLDGGALAGCNVATVNLLPIFGSIDAYAARVHDAVERLRAASGAAHVRLVGHSMGGLAIRAYLRDHGDGAVARVVTIAAPHHGTELGRFGFGRNASQMVRGSAYLRALGDALTPAARRKFVCIATLADNLVVPRTSPLLPDARHVVLDGVGHLAMVEDTRVWQAVREAVLAPADAA
jgi:pimeloyl-ACP methyl ester carboxylesterase